MTRPDLATSFVAEVDVIVEDLRWAEAVDLGGLADRAVQSVLGHLRIDVPCELSILGASDDRIAALNSEFRDKPQPTNVLSWPAEDLSPEQPGGAPARPLPDPTGEAVFLGDIALAYETCDREAQIAEKPLKDHILHLIVHGILHLLGYDHVEDRDADLMERHEVAILAQLGVASPYA